MEHQTKRVCQFPGCHKRLPHSRGHSVHDYCVTHAQVHDDYTHQLPFGVLSAKYLAELTAEAV